MLADSVRFQKPTNAKPKNVNSKAKTTPQPETKKRQIEI
jgi:hypothetical protein